MAQSAHLSALPGTERAVRLLPSGLLFTLWLLWLLMLEGSRVGSFEPVTHCLALLSSFSEGWRLNVGAGSCCRGLAW